jgi:hypothetical protein
MQRVFCFKKIDEIEGRSHQLEGGVGSAGRTRESRGRSENHLFEFMHRPGTHTHQFPPSISLSISKDLPIYLTGYLQEKNM